MIYSDFGNNQLLNNVKTKDFWNSFILLNESKLYSDKTPNQVYQLFIDYLPNTSGLEKTYLESKIEGLKFIRQLSEFYLGKITVSEVMDDQKVLYGEMDRNLFNLVNQDKIEPLIQNVIKILAHKFHEVINSYYEPVLKIDKSDQILNCKEIADLIQNTYAEFKLKNKLKNDITINFNPRVITAAVNSNQGIFHLNPNLERSKNNVIAMMSHEFTHILRGYRGKMIFDDQLMSRGLSGNAKIDEGLATAVELICQEYREISNSHTLDRILSRYFVVGNVIFNNYSLDEISQKYADKYNSSVLTAVKNASRGFDASTKGFCYIRPKMYLEGLVKALNYLIDSANPETTFDYITSAKFDFSNPVHVEYYKSKLAEQV